MDVDNATGECQAIHFQMRQGYLRYQVRYLVFPCQAVGSVQEVCCAHLSRIALLFALDLIRYVVLLQALGDRVVLFCW